jgi:hypothetical protein
MIVAMDVMGVSEVAGLLSEAYVDRLVPCSNEDLLRSIKALKKSKP